MLGTSDPRARDDLARGRTAPEPVARPGAGQAAPARRRSSPMRRRQAVTGWLFVLPFVAVFAVFMLVPLVSSVVLSLTDFSVSDIRDPLGVNFDGLARYTEVLGDERFLTALRNTAYFVVVGVPLTMVVALALALALDSGITRLRTVFRVAFYTPVVTSIVAVAVVWRFILQPDGLVNGVLGSVGIDGPDWLHSTTWAMPSLIAMATWRNMGTLMIVFLAGLQAVPRELHEAGMVDGASAWQRLTRITLPVLRPTLLLGAVMITVGYLQFFEEPFVMTRGGPLDSTLSATYFVFDEFGFGNYSLASAASYVIFVIIVAFTLLQFRLLRSEKDS